MKKKKYDTSVVMLYLIGKERLLPKAFRKQIPYSTISSWRKTDYSTYLGQEFRFLFEDNYDILHLKKQCRDQSRLLRSIAKVWILLHEDLFPAIKAARSNPALQKRVVTAINCLKVSIGLSKSLALFGLTSKIYQEWSIIIRGYCTASHSFLCVKRYPHQLQKKEVQQIKKALTTPKQEHWPIVSIAALGLRKGNIIASLYSWYKYARMMNLTHKAAKKHKRLIGLLAKKPNEYLHVDTTYYAISEEQKVCITFVMDNYSKMILGFQLAEKLSFEIVKEALIKALKTVALHPDQQPGFLVADGGKENHNHHIDQFIAQLTDFKLTKIRSLKDIKFSNSPVEAIHRIIKGRYLRNKRFDSLDQLQTYLEWSVNDYNRLRPHYKHTPKTPYEVYFGQVLNFDIKERMKGAAKDRVVQNKELPCKACVNNAIVLLKNFKSM